MPARAQSPNHTAPSTTGIAPIAKRTRCAKFDSPRRSRALALASVMIAECWSGGDLSEPPLAALVLQDRREQIAPREVRPHDGDDVQLRVRELPEHEVRNAVLPGRTDKEIGIRGAVGIQVSAEHLLIDVRGVETTVSSGLREMACRANELRPRAVRDEQLHRQPIIGRRRVNTPRDGLTSCLREALEVAKH